MVTGIAFEIAVDDEVNLLAASCVTVRNYFRIATYILVKSHIDEFRPDIVGEKIVEIFYDHLS